MNSTLEKELSIEQLREIKRILEESAQSNEGFMTIDELAVYMALSKSALYKLTSKNEIPFYTPGGKKMYFRKREIDEWIERSRVATHEEVMHATMARLNNTLN